MSSDIFVGNVQARSREKWAKIFRKSKMRREMDRLFVEHNCRIDWRGFAS